MTVSMPRTLVRHSGVPGACCVTVPGPSLSELAVARQRDDRRRGVVDFVAAAIAASAPEPPAKPQRMGYE